jgi:hypothetical protein
MTAMTVEKLARKMYENSCHTVLRRIEGDITEEGCKFVYDFQHKTCRGLDYENPFIRSAATNP